MVNLSKSYCFKGARAGYVCLFWLDSSYTHWINAEWLAPSTEPTRSETPRQLSQHRRHQHLRRFPLSAMNQLTWSLTPHWLSRHGVSLGIDSVDREWDSASTESPPNVFKNRISRRKHKQNWKHSKDLLFGLYTVWLINAKKQKKIPCESTFNWNLAKSLLTPCTRS